MPSKKKAIEVKTVYVTQPQQQKKKKRRNRRKPQKQQMSKRARYMSIPKGVKRTLSRLMNIDMETDTIRSGVDSLLHSLFVSTHGVTRGVSQGVAPTALCGFQDVYDIPVLAGGIVNLTFTPNAANAGNFLLYGSATASAVALGFTSGLSPFNNSFTGTTIGTYNGPFNATNPTNGEWRCVGFSLRLIPTTNLLNQAGYVNIAHIPMMFSNWTGTGNLSSANYTGPSTAKELQNQAYRRKFKCTDEIVYNWFPSSTEVPMQPYGTSAISDALSGVYISIVNTSPTSAISYDLDYQVYYEYGPGSNSVGIVEKELATVHPSAYYYLTQFIVSNWQPCVLGTLDEWECLVKKIDPIVTHYKLGYDRANRIGIPTRQALTTIPELDEEEKSETISYSKRDMYLNPYKQDTLSYRTAEAWAREYDY